MDALIYTVMSGAERAMRAQQVHANNLANLETPGFRADLEVATAYAVPGYGYDARHMSSLQADTVASRQGSVRETGRDLDVAVQDQGYLAVQWQEGEAYTRAGGLTVDGDGALTVNGRPVLGDGGPIVLPPYTRLSIAVDGTVSIQEPGQEIMQPVDRLKLVKPAPGSVTKNEAGLVVPRDGNPLPSDETVTVKSGHLEGSNVSAVEEMVSTMTLSRDFEVQMKLYKAADAMAEAGNRLVRD
ncbi:MAG: flagellar basal body rod protein FlgF [Actinomycetota bacterium]